MIPAADQIEMYRLMLLIRRLEERVAEIGAHARARGVEGERRAERGLRGERETRAQPVEARGRVAQ